MSELKLKAQLKVNVDKNPSSQQIQLKKVVPLQQRTQQICRQSECYEQIAEYPKAHKHSTVNCSTHKFCRENTMPVFEEKSQSKSILGIPNEMIVDPWHVMTSQDQQSNDYRQILENYHNSYSIFQQPKQQKLSIKQVSEPLKMIPQGRKVVMTDQVIDTWLAAHYGIDPDHVPRKQPQSVPRHLFERFKKLRALSYTQTQGFRNKRQSNASQPGQDAKNANNKNNKRESKNQTQNSNENRDSHNFQYRLAPENFNLISYPKEMEGLKSITDKTIQYKTAGDRMTDTPQLQLAKSTSKLNNSITQSNKQQLLETGISQSQQTLPRTLERSRSQFLSSYQGPLGKQQLNGGVTTSPSQLIQSLTQEFHQKFGEDAEYYQPPSKDVRNRQHSEHLRFLNYQEIAQSKKKLDEFDGRIIQKQIDGRLHPQKMPKSDQKVIKQQNHQKLQQLNLVNRRYEQLNYKQQEEPSKIVKFEVQQEQEDDDEKQQSQLKIQSQIKDSMQDDLMIQIPEVSLQYQSDRLGASRTQLPSQLNKYSIQHFQKLHDKQNKMQTNIYKFFHPKNTLQPTSNESLTKSTQSFNVQKQTSQKKLISERNNQFYQIQQNQFQSTIGTTDSKLQSLPFSPKIVKNVTAFSQHKSRKQVSARSNKNKFDPNNGVSASLVTGSHQDMLTMVNSARDNMTHRNMATEFGSTKSGTLNNDQSMRSSLNILKRKQRLSEMFNKRMQDRSKNMQKQNYLTQQPLNVMSSIQMPSSHFKTSKQRQKEKTQQPIMNLHETLNQKKNSQSRNVIKGKYKSVVQSIGQRVKQEKYDTNKIVQKHVLQNRLIKKYCIQTTSVKIPGYAILSQQNFYKTQPKMNSKTLQIDTGLTTGSQNGKPEFISIKNDLNKEPSIQENVGPSFLRYKEIKKKFGIEMDECDQISEESQHDHANASQDEIDCAEMLQEELQTLQRQILNFLNNDQDKQGEFSHREVQQDDEDKPNLNPSDIINFQIKFITFDLRQNTYHKDFKDYRFWIKIAQKKFQDGDNDDLAIDFLRNGLREIPRSAQLLYNFACANEKIGKYSTAIRFFQFASKMKLNWCDALFGEAVTHFKIQNYAEAEQCISKAIKSYHRADSLEDIDVMLYFKAMVYKKLMDYPRAKRDYESLQKLFCHNEAESVLHFVIGLILLPLRESRREKFDYLENLLKLIKHFKRVQPKEKVKLLSNYIDKKTGYLDIQKNKQILLGILKNEPFFKRFDVVTLEKFIAKGKPEYYNHGEIIFLHDRVGIITHGSIRIKNHQQNILSPTVEAKYGKGKILGHHSDNGVTTNPQSWIITYDEGTEILFFQTEVFNQLWNIQFQKTDRQIIEANIECNPLLRCLSDQSQYQIIYEDMEIRKFKPGQLICRMSKRSKLNSLFNKLQEIQASRLMEDMEIAKAMQQVEEGQGQSASETVISGFVKSLTTHKGHGIQSAVQDFFGQSPTKIGEPQTDQAQQAAQATQLKQDEQADHKKKEEEEMMKECKQHPQYINLVEGILKDQVYKEIDGVYIVYQGHVDILSQKDNKLLHQINIFENFGESIIVNTPSYEYFGDLYAGLNPRNPQEARTVRDMVKDQIKKSRTNIEQKVQNKRDEFKKGSSKSQNRVTFQEEQVKISRQERLIQKLKSMEEQLLTNTDDLVDFEDCTICLYIPYEKFESLPACEVKSILDEATLFKLNESVVKLISEAYDVSEDLLKIY